jgi:hypothetical protein
LQLPFPAPLQPFAGFSLGSVGLSCGSRSGWQHWLAVAIQVQKLLSSTLLVQKHSEVCRRID